VPTSTTIEPVVDSAALFERAQRVIPGGVNSPVRAFGSVGGTPRFISRASGAYVYDTDDRQFIDYVGSWGPMLLGHAHPEVIAAVQVAAENGLSFGAPTRLEVTMAEMICNIVPSIELVRMCSSGTEATMSAIRLALNDEAALKSLFETHGDALAGVIVEPIAGNMNFVEPLPGYLQTLRELCTKHGAILIFDEVMTGFRVALGGAQQHYGITPDLTTLGKVIGGGMPVGAFGGRRDIMEHIAPAGPVYQAGTLSGNPIAMSAGIKTLELLSRTGFHDELHAMTGKLLAGLQSAADKHGVPFCSSHAGGMFGFFFSTESKVCNFEQVMACNNDHFKAFFHHMLDEGVYLAPSAFEAGFSSGAHTEDDINKTIAAADKAFAAIAAS